MTGLFVRESVDHHVGLAGGSGGFDDKLSV
jgi:hypothetical protein